MRPRLGGAVKALAPLPEGYELSVYDEAAFTAHAFGHGANYADFEAFRENGSGAVVRFEGKIVASASSFLSFHQHVELDVFTSPDHRRKGLADRCVDLMMNDCASRGITVHWDAQNEPSTRMAVSHGFEIEQDYAVYLLKR